MTTIHDVTVEQLGELAAKVDELSQECAALRDDLNKAFLEIEFLSDDLVSEVRVRRQFMGR